MDPRPGDIVLFRPRGWGWLLSPISLAIKWFQRLPVTHTAILAFPETETVIEAYYPRVRKSKIGSRLGFEWCIVRPKDVSDAQAAWARNRALELVGKGYDVQGILYLGWLLLLEWSVGAFIRDRVRIADRPDRLFCQELVTYCYESTGFKFSEMMGFKDPSAITPGDVGARTREGLFDRVKASPGWTG